MKNFCRLRHTFCEEIIAEKDKMDEKRLDILMDVSIAIIIIRNEHVQVYDRIIIN